MLIAMARRGLAFAFQHLLAQLVFLMGWELAGNFLHVFQLLYYASFWNEWNRLEILSHDKTSLEAIYLNAQAKKHGLTQFTKGHGLVSAVLTFELHGCTLQKDPQTFTANRNDFTYLRGVGQVVDYLQRVWKPEMLLLLPTGSINMYE